MSIHAPRVRLAVETVTVIGAGIAGLSASLRLLEKGYTVRIIDREPLGRAASTRSAGLVVTLFPEDLLRVALESVDFYMKLDPTLIRPVKSLWIARDRACMERVITVHQKYGLRSGMIDEDEVPEGIELRGSESAALIEEYIVDVGRALSMLYTRVSKLGATIVEKDVSKLQLREDSATVLAAGAWSPLLYPELGDHLTIYRCQIASIEGARPPLTIEDDSIGYYIVPVGPSRSNIGDGANTVIDDPWDGFNTDMEDIYNIIERYAMRNPDAWNSRVIQAWSAPCVTSGDGNPIIDRLSENLIVFTGLNGAGITLAPGLSRYVVSLLEDGFTPEKFRLSTKKKAGGKTIEPYDVC